ncbi:Aste57867_9707 [Aphanomyces stellatus]|uniref:Aste57867_9707 protein n=1 Tax=Aphanomyces stellatus TaxID=120398 RepID=A0A485KP02_9STRA|nr:hypothetical protein As57867_009669 [Aphanomyces stellatus]VFT86586.1 Aste57867_9707 [Aphanomyces stellatus]
MLVGALFAQLGIDHIFSYQDGVFHDLLPLCPFLDRPFEAHVDIFHPCFASWYASRGHAGVARLLQCRPACLPYLMRYAVWSGHMELAATLHQRDRPLLMSLEKILDLAASRDHLNMLAWLHGHDYAGCTYRAMNAAAARGNLSIVRFLHDHRTEGCSRSAMNGAMINGHLGVVAFLHNHRTEGCTPYGMDITAKNGHLDVIQFLHAHRTEGCTADALTWAAAYGHLEVVRFLHEMRTEGYAPWAIEAAAAGGHTAIVQFLESHPKDNDVGICDSDVVFSGRDFDF